MKLSDLTKLVIRSAPSPHVAQLTLNRPSKRNALSNELIAVLASALRAAAQDDAVRCVVICGDEGFFSAGADIKEMQQRGFEAIDNRARRSAWKDISDFTKPLIAAVDGICYGGGMNWPCSLISPLPARARPSDNRKSTLEFCRATAQPSVSRASRASRSPC